MAADGRFVCRWVMPYETSGTVRLLNLGAVPETADLTVRTDSWVWDTNSMHFHANWRPDDAAKFPSHFGIGTEDYYGRAPTSNRPSLPSEAAQPITSLAELQAQSDLIKAGGVLVVPGAIEVEDLQPFTSSPEVTAVSEAPSTASASQPSPVSLIRTTSSVPATAPSRGCRLQTCERSSTISPYVGVP